MKKRHFTLLELLTVVAILALISGGVIVAFSDLEDSARANVGQYQTSVIRDAMIKFRKDMGYYPKQKRLAYNFLDLDAISAVDKQAWIEDEENFYQLFVEPVHISKSDFWKWDTESGVGWNGPYLDLEGAVRETDERITILDPSGLSNFKYDPATLEITYTDSNNTEQTITLPK